VIETLGRAGLTLGEALEREEDLETVKRAVIREQVIRDSMAQTGEPREIVAEMLDAVRSMDHEAVEELTEGEPTTLRDGLERYVNQLGRLIEGDPGATSGDVLNDLGTLLAYSWPAGDGEGPEDLAQYIHAAYVRLAPSFGVEVLAWADLAPYQRELAVAICRDLLSGGIIRPALA
jgi:hypothetical protein